LKVFPKILGTSTCNITPTRPVMNENVGYPVTKAEIWRVFVGR